MVMNKPKKPGDVIGVRLPKDTPEEVIYYLNQSRSETLSSFCADVLVVALKQKIQEQKNNFTNISLPIKLPNEIIIKLQQDDILNLITDTIIRLLSKEASIPSLQPSEDGKSYTLETYSTTSRKNASKTRFLTDKETFILNQDEDAFEKLILKNKKENFGRH